MVILEKFKLKDVISFETHASQVLPQDYERVTVIGVIPASDCHLYGFDAYAVHAQVFRLVPAGTMDNDPESYDYLRLRTLNGETRIVGIPWINASTIKVFKKTTASFIVEDIAQEDVNKIRLAIARHGYSCRVDLS